VPDDGITVNNANYECAPITALRKKTQVTNQLELSDTYRRQRELLKPYRRQQRELLKAVTSSEQQALFEWVQITPILLVEEWSGRFLVPRRN
jgi:hypothetical protein